MAKAAKKESKATIPTPPVSEVRIATPKAPKAKGVKFDGDWAKIPSTRQLLALVIMSLESGTPITIPLTRDAARAALGYAAR